MKNFKTKIKVLADSYQLFNLREKLTGYRLEKESFKQALGYELDLKNPKSFNQKIVWKKLYDRNPLLPIAADKYRARDYIIKILGKEEGNKILIPLLYVTDKPETIPFDHLPDEYVIKANHASGWIKIKSKEETINREKIINQCKEWLAKPFGHLYHEWAYQKIKRKIVIEKLLRTEDGKIPDDIKFFIFHGKCELILVVHDRFHNPRQILYDPSWNYLQVTTGTGLKGPEIAKPTCLSTMLTLAEALGQEFDFVRIDLYAIKNKIYFGEFTNYPTSARKRFNPQSFDFELGSKLHLTPKYWKKNRKFLRPQV